MVVKDSSPGFAAAQDSPRRGPREGGTFARPPPAGRLAGAPPARSASAGPAL